MNITSITASSSINIFTGETWLKVTITADVPPGDNADDFFDKLSQKSDEYQAKWKSKRLQLIDNNSIPVVQGEKIKEDTPPSLIEQMNTCTDAKVLEQTYKFLVRKDAALNEAYRKRLVELTK